MPDKKKTVIEERKNETVIYLGPCIPGVVSSGTIFNHGLTQQLKGAISEMPSLNMLLISVKDVARAKIELRKETSALKICYEKAVKYAAQKGAK